MKNTRKRSMKGGGCGCASSSVLGFPQAGGQMKKSSMFRRRGQNSSSMQMPGSMGEPSMGVNSMQMPGSMEGPGMGVNTMRVRRENAPQMPQSNITGTLASIQSKLNSINAKISSMPKQSAPTTGLFGGGQNGGFLGLFENSPQTTVPPANASQMNSVVPQQPSVPSAQNIVKMPAVTATNTGSANQRIRNLEDRLAKMESKGGFSFFGGGRKRKTRKTRKLNKKRRTYRK